MTEQAIEKSDHKLASKLLRDYHKVEEDYISICKEFMKESICKEFMEDPDTDVRPSMLADAVEAAGNNALRLVAPLNRKASELYQQIPEKFR